MLGLTKRASGFLNFGGSGGGGGGSTSLPIATNNILGGVKVGGGLNITDDGVLSSDLNYSENTPIYIGRWIDGRPIYRIVLKQNTTKTSTNIPIDNSIDKVIKVSGYATNSNGLTISANTSYGVSSTSFGVGSYCDNSANTLMVVMGSAFTSSSITIIYDFIYKE